MVIYNIIQYIYKDTFFIRFVTKNVYLVSVKSKCETSKKLFSYEKWQLNISVINNIFVTGTTEEVKWKLHRKNAFQVIDL